MNRPRELKGRGRMISRVRRRLTFIEPFSSSFPVLIRRSSLIEAGIAARYCARRRFGRGNEREAR